MKKPIPLKLRLLRAYCHHFPIMKGKWRLITWGYHNMDIPDITAISRLDGTLNITLQLNIWVDFNIYCLGLYEFYLANFFKQQLKPDTVFIDVGAYIGQYSLLAARAAPEGKVYAFEPNRVSAKRLKENIDQNILPNTHVIQKAVGDKIGEVTFYVSPQPFQSSVVSSHANHQQVVQVPISTLDSFYEERNISRVDIIKIDVEEAEDEVIRGARKLLKSTQPLVIIEIGKSSASKGSSEALHELDILEYKFYVLNRDRLIPFLGRLSPGMEIIAIPSPGNQMQG